MLFDATHIIYIVVSTLATVGLLLLTKFCKTERSKNITLKALALTTCFLHISTMWVNFLIYGSSSVADNILFPIYFCNFMMYLVVVIAFMKNKHTMVFKYFAAFVAIGGIFGGVVSTLYPDYYLITPNLADYGVLKSMLSHSVLIICGLYLFLGGFIQFRVNNTIAMVLGFSGCAIVGVLINTLFVACGLPNPNAMYLVNPPIAEVPWIDCYVISTFVVVMIFITASLYELRLAKEDRWYTKLKPVIAKYIKII